MATRDRLNPAQQAAYEADCARGRRLFAAVERLVFGAPGSAQERRWNEFLGRPST
jgi:hypothetical protein